MNVERIGVAAFIVGVLSSFFAWISFQVCGRKSGSAKRTCNDALLSASFVATLAFALVEYAVAYRGGSSGSGSADMWR